MSELIFLDLEWNTTFYRSRTGERLPFHELIEVAAIKVEKDTGAMLDSFHSYVHPKASRKIDSRTYRLLPYERGELQELLYAAPGFLDLGPAFLHWCGAAPVFVEWGSNDVEVLLSNFAFHHLSFDADWTCEYYDLQYIYQKLLTGELGCQPSLEKAVTDLDRRLREKRGEAGDLSVVAMNCKGEFGCATNIGGFSFSVAAEGLEPVVYLVTREEDGRCSFKEADQEWLEEYMRVRMAPVVE